MFIIRLFFPAFTSWILAPGNVAPQDTAEDLEATDATETRQGGTGVNGVDLTGLTLFYGDLMGLFGVFVGILWDFIGFTLW